MSDGTTCPCCGADMAECDDPSGGDLTFYTSLGRPMAEGLFATPCCGEAIYLSMKIRTVEKG